MLGRPHRVRPLVRSLHETVPGARVLFLLSPQDHPVRAAVKRSGYDSVAVPYNPQGDFARKINFGYRMTTEQLIFCGADDLNFHPGWFEAAAARLTDGVGVVGTNDLGNPRVLAGEHATHWLVTRTYADTYGTADAPGQILHEGYWHEWVDDELVATAKHRGAYAFAEDSIVEHLHPNWGKAPNDGMYQQQHTRMRYGKRVYASRRHLWT